MFVDAFFTLSRAKYVITTVEILSVYCTWDIKVSLKSAIACFFLPPPIVSNLGVDRVFAEVRVK